MLNSMKLIQLKNAQKKWQYVEQNNYISREAITAREIETSYQNLKAEASYSRFLHFSRSLSLFIAQNSTSKIYHYFTSDWWSLMENGDLWAFCLLSMKFLAIVNCFFPFISKRSRLLFKLFFPIFPFSHWKSINLLNLINQIHSRE